MQFPVPSLVFQGWQSPPTVRGAAPGLIGNRRLQAKSRRVRYRPHVGRRTALPHPTRTA